MVPRAADRGALEVALAAPSRSLDKNRVVDLSLADRRACMGAEIQNGVESATVSKEADFTLADQMKLSAAFG